MGVNHPVFSRLYIWGWNIWNELWGTFGYGRMNAPMAGRSSWVRGPVLMSQLWALT